MKDVTKMADRIALNLEKMSLYFKTNWKSVLVVFWMLLVTITLMQQQKAIEEASSYHQVANLRLSVDDVRYSVKAMEEEVEKVERSVTQMENAIRSMETSVNRIYTQVRHTPEG
ncbi:hypothetical protein P4C99_05665 [Pontiellaceae bacterium B1224]|nr:hypothetical protein [Pontiellaceae bacterium B1224]